jgi:hypothetical protein
VTSTPTNAAGATGRVARPVKYGGDNGKPWRGALFHRARRTMLGDDGNLMQASGNSFPQFILCYFVFDFARFVLFCNMNINDLEKLKTELENSHKANMAAVEQLLGKMRETLTKPASSIIQAPRREERMSEIVERAITNFAGNFNVASISRKYAEITARQASRSVRREISSCINKLKHRNPPEIIEVEKGKGSRSGIYKMRTN